MCPEFVCGVAHTGAQAQGTLVSFFRPSATSLIWLTTGIAVGVGVGCLGASVLRPCAALQFAPVGVAVAALYAVAYLS